MSDCKHQSYAPDSAIESLPPSQAGKGRHRCVVCAYEKGRRDGYKAAIHLLVDKENA